MTIDVDDLAEVAFVYRDSDGTLTSPDNVTVTIRDPSGNETVKTDADPDVTIGATLADHTRRECGITAAENTAGTGVVQLLWTIDEAGEWQFRCVSSGVLVGAERINVTARAQFDT